MKLPFRIPSLPSLGALFKRRRAAEADDDVGLGDALDGVMASATARESAEAEEALDAAGDVAANDAEGERGDEGALGDDGSEAAHEEGAEPSLAPPGRLKVAPEDRPAARKKAGGRLRKIAGRVLTAVVVLVPIAAFGATVGWLAVNAGRTMSERQAMEPTLTVSILEPGMAPEPNESQNAKSQDAHGGDTAHGDGHSSGSDDGHGTAPNDAHGGAAGAGDGHGAPAPAADTFQLVDPALVEENDRGRLPIIAADGRRSVDVYRRPFDDGDRRPRLAIVVSLLGLSDRTTQMAIRALPPEVTLSFATYAPKLNDWVTEARRAGHEVLLDLPMEPNGFPKNDPGPDTLLTSLSAVENLNRLEMVLGRTGGYVGVLGFAGSRFTVVEEALTPILEALAERGLMFLDSRSSSRSLAAELAASVQLPRAYNNRFLDLSPSSSDIDRQLEDLEDLARANRSAVGIGHAYPVTIERLAAWTTTLEAKGIALAPISSLADRQSLK